MDLAKVYIQAKDLTATAFESFKRNTVSAGDSLSRFNGLLAGLGVGLSAGAFAALVKSSVDAMDRLNDLNKTTSITIERLAGLQLAAKQSGGDLESIAASINKMSVNMGKDADKFKALGISAKEPLEAFKQLSDIIVQIEDPQKRAALSAAVLGKSWAGAAPLLSEGGAKIQEMVDKGTRLSGMTGEAARNADDFNDKMAELNLTLGATKTKLVSDMLPAMNDIADATREAAKEGGLLLAVWVALGGAAANLIKTSNSVKLANTDLTIDGIKTRLDFLNENPGPYARINESKKADLADALSAAIATRESLLKLMTPPVFEKPSVNAAGARAANSRVDTFLGGDKAGTGAAKDSGFDALLDGLRKKLELDKESTELEKLNLDLLTKKYELIKPAQAEELRVAAMKVDGKTREQKMLDDLVKHEEVIAKLDEEKIARMTGFLISWSEYRQNLEFETDMIGKTETQRQTAIALRKLDADFQKAIVGLLGEELDYVIRINEQNKALIPTLIKQNVARGEAVKQTEKLLEDTKRMNEDIGRSLTDALMRGFESGKGFARNFRDTLVNMFKTLVLRPIISPIMTGTAGVITGALGLAGNARAAGDGGAGGLGNMFGMASNANSLLGGGGIGAGIFGSAAAYSTALGLSSAAVGSQAAMLAAQTGVFGAAGLGATASAAGATGAAGAMAAVPYIGWAIAAIAAISALSGKGKGGPASTTPSILSGTASQDGLDGMFYGTAQNSKQSFQWPNQGAFDRDAPVFNAEIKKAYAAMEEIGKLLGVNTSLLAGATAQINWRIPVNEVTTAANLAPQMGQLTDQLALQMIPSLVKFAQANETATQTLLRLVEVQGQLEAKKAQIIASLPNFRRELSGRLGIGTLTDYQNSLAVSDYRSPMDRFGAAQDQLSSTYSRAMGGDLSAVNAFPQQLQQALGIGRDVFASGPEFQRLFVEGNRQLNELLSTQQNLQRDMFAELPITIQEASHNEIAELRLQTKAVVDGIKSVEEQLRLIREAA